MKRTSIPIVAVILALQVASAFSQTVKPAIQWKYGWRDGNKANTTGNAKSGDPIPAASTTLTSGYSPAQIATAYGFDKIASTGAGKTIAIIDAYGSPNVQKDLNTFCAQYGLPQTTVNIYYPSGNPAKPDSGWASETALDVEWAHAMAPGATIALVVSPDASLTNLLAAVNYATGTLKATVVSMSWGAAESAGLKTYDSYFNKPGIDFVASSGDSGKGVEWPAVSPYVLGVGGTTLVTNASSGAVTSETAWNMSGGGLSVTQMLPTYQSGWNLSPGRGVPDVSYNGDPYTGVSVYFTDPTTNVGGWYIYGGTSAGAPQWAALLARRAALGNAGTNAIGTVIYAAAKTNYAGLLRDIISGSNGLPATVKYDFVTGLGSPIAPAVATLPNTGATPAPTPTPTPVPTPTPTPTPKPTPVPTPTPTPKPTPSPTPVSSDSIVYRLSTSGGIFGGFLPLAKNQTFAYSNIIKGTWSANANSLTLNLTSTYTPWSGTYVFAMGAGGRGQEIAHSSRVDLFGGMYGVLVIQPNWYGFPATLPWYK